MIPYFDITGPLNVGFAIGVATEAGHADIWFQGTPFQLAGIVQARDQDEAAILYARTHPSVEAVVLASACPEHIATVKARRCSN
jgi:hypothetical protein